jgi:hypothetical protein
MMGVEGDKGLNVISTSHEHNTEQAASFLLKNKLWNGYTIRKYIHNHPRGTTNPSGDTDRTDPVTGRFDPAGTWGDIGFARWIYNRTHNKNTTFLIYTRIVGYKQYLINFE